MPWTKKNYPDSLQKLPAGVRAKAIAIGNALLKEKREDEGFVIAIAISRAREWAADRGMKTERSKKHRFRPQKV